MDVDPQIAALMSLRLLSNGTNHKNDIFYKYTMKITAGSAGYDDDGRPILAGVKELVDMFHAAFEKLFAEELKRENVLFFLVLENTHRTELDGATFMSKAWGINPRA